MRLLLLVMFLIGCGDGGGSGSTPLTADTSTQAKEKDKEKTSEEKVSVSAKLVKADEDYPDCDDLSDGQLIYVQDEAIFYYCDKNDGWVSIDLKGKDGAVGTNGKDGSNGTNGKDGKDGTNGKDGKNPSTSEWTDPLSSRRFILVAGKYADFAIDSTSVCPSGTTTASASEVVGAYWYFNKEFIYNVTAVSGGNYSKSVMGNTGLYTIRSDLDGSTVRPFICKIVE